MSPPHDKLTYEIIGCAMRVHNILGFGFHEKPYENALAIELRSCGYTADQQRGFPIWYKQIVVGEYIPDLVINDEVLADLKVVDSIGAAEIGQMVNYLHVTGMRTGLILNFRNAELQYKRVAGRID